MPLWGHGRRDLGIGGVSGWTVGIQAEGFYGIRHISTKNY